MEPFQIVVKDLPPGMDATFVANFLGSAGPVLEVNVNNLEAVVTFASKEAAENAMKQFNYYKFNGNPIRMIKNDPETQNIIQQQKGIIIIHGVDQDVDISEVYQFFSQVGEIVSIQMMPTDWGSFTFVILQYRNPADSEVARSKLNGYLVNGKPISIEVFNAQAKTIGDIQIVTPSKPVVQNTTKNIKIDKTAEEKKSQQNSSDSTQSVDQQQEQIDLAALAGQMPLPSPALQDIKKQIDQENQQQHEKAVKALQARQKVEQPNFQYENIPNQEQMMPMGQYPPYDYMYYGYQQPMNPYYPQPGMFNQYEMQGYPQQMPYPGFTGQSPPNQPFQGFTGQSPPTQQFMGQYLPGYNGQQPSEPYPPEEKPKPQKEEPKMPSLYPTMPLTEETGILIRNLPKEYQDTESFNKLIAELGQFTGCSILEDGEYIFGIANFVDGSTAQTAISILSQQYHLEAGLSKMASEFIAKQGPSRRRTLFVGGLVTDVTEKDLLNFFKQFGTVESCGIKKDKDTGLSKGMGFVCFKSIKSAEKCKKSSGKLDLKGKCPFFTYFRGPAPNPSSIQEMEEINKDTNHDENKMPTPDSLDSKFIPNMTNIDEFGMEGK
ncbi:hypothetical protein TVAG_361530 [Trichomonas vaginalis G3]|uniref:RRM domain-containing protein n=1 Tax=Trichomonas vaginalis (strain ATCC PRA-98 / G3) TaxID=412133 RepID=A2FQN0_TRIV3|nr:poly(U) RNA binding [Trichomonas vaginalis G3]EAX92773.1 hypothetical protein TVAG_361530 [Trichomonas vaginalis G3]KAI5524679.1 poly(U) RNA binding [Trichomonas vaginalis G3]|eukprot:XP_001305703.1 hypothetical protein [Trichomonas vaginalis G3]